MIGPRGLGKGGKSVASSCSEGGTAGVRTPRARAACQSNVARILAAPCTHKRPASRATFSTSAAATRHSLSPLLPLVCARGARACVARASAAPGAGASWPRRVRRRSPPLAPDSAQCRLAPAPAPAPTCARGAACLARTVLAASLCCIAGARPASASASWAGCLPTGPYQHRTLWLREVCARLLATILLGVALRLRGCSSCRCYCCLRVRPAARATRC